MQRIVVNLLMVSVKICLFSLWVMSVWLVQQEIIRMSWSGQL